MDKPVKPTPLNMCTHKALCFFKECCVHSDGHKKEYLYCSSDKHCRLNPDARCHPANEFVTCPECLGNLPISFVETWVKNKRKEDIHKIQCPVCYKSFITDWVPQERIKKFI